MGDDEDRFGGGLVGMETSRYEPRAGSSSQAGAWAQVAPMAASRKPCQHRPVATVELDSLREERHAVRMLGISRSGVSQSGVRLWSREAAMLCGQRALLFRPGSFSLFALGQSMRAYACFPYWAGPC